MLNVLLVIPSQDRPTQDFLTATLSHFGVVWALILPENAKSGCDKNPGLVKLSRVSPTLSSTRDTYLFETKPVALVDLAKKTFGAKFDVCVFALNKGLLLGSDLAQSPLFALAQSATSTGVPTCLISGKETLSDNFKLNFKTWLNEYFLKKMHQKYSLLNVNLPTQAAKATYFTELADFKTTYQFLKEEQSETALVFKTMLSQDAKISQKQTDLSALEKGAISATPILTNLTDFTKI